MICINCFHAKTKVTNSRRHKKQPTVWRRRQCPDCQTIFTSYERPALDDQLVHGEQTSRPFYIGKLTISIAESFQHDPEKASLDSFHLAQTVEMKLLLAKQTITTQLIAETTHQTLQHFDPIAGLQYAIKHQLITTTRRPGRPSASYR